MNELRLLNSEETRMVAGGLSVCPVDEWWNPNWLTDDAGSIGSMPARNGPYDGYWTNGDIWCLYDENNNLLGIYREDPNGSLTITFESSSSVQGQVLNLPYDSSSGGGYTVSLQKIQ